MFIGHFAVALAARRGAPHAPLGWLFAACQLPDLIWPLLLLAGAERAHIDPGIDSFLPLVFDHYPWSHSLLLVAAAAFVFALIYRARTGDGRGAAAIATLVLSHWLLDWITHLQDLPLVPTGMPGDEIQAGLGLWRFTSLTLTLEFSMLAAGIWLYGQETRARSRTGQRAFWGLIIFLSFIHLMNAFGPPPPNMTAVAIGCLAIWLLVWWASWADKHREPVRVSTRAPA